MDEKITGQSLARRPAFLSADDAARDAHERIGDRRQVEFGSVILQRLADRLFVASEPVAGQATTFNWTRLLDRSGPAADFIDPPGYRIVGSLHSHPDRLAATRQQNPTWTQQQVRTFMSFYSVPDIGFNYQERARFTQAYLSGPDGALLKYQPTGSAAEAGFVHWLATNGPWTSPHAHDGTVEGVYRKLASVGRLSFVLSSPAWGGSMGPVPTNWVPYQAFDASPMPLPCGPVFADKQQALLRAWSRIQRQPTLKQHVLVLQHDTLAQFVASEPQALLCGDDPLPAGFHLHGIYLHSRPLPGLYPALDTWLYKNFIGPQELASQIAQFRQYSQGPGSTLGASLYIRMRDEAVLRYRFSGSAAESQLFMTAAHGQVIDNGLQAAMLAGRLLTRDFVQQVAGAGELTVEKTSALWDRPGVVDGQWRPYANVALPLLSRVFLSADDAVQQAHRVMGEQRDQAFAGLVLVRQDGRFQVTEPQPCGPRPFAFNAGYPTDRQGAPIILHAGLQLHGRYGSRVALSVAGSGEVGWTQRQAELDAQLFSEQDVSDLRQAAYVGYLSTDSLIAWRPGDVRAAVTPQDRVRMLAANGGLRVVVANALWGPCGAVEPDWEAYERILQYQRPEPVSHGAVFATADEAARDRHRDTPQSFGEGHVVHYFGFVLKHEDAEAYVASELIPVTTRSKFLSLAALYGEVLPDGFVCHALYYTRQWPGFGLKEGLERFFVLPENLDLAIAQARINAAGSAQGTPVYIAPPEGALLCYQSPGTDALFEAQSTGDAADVVQAKLDSGTLTPVQFVRQVAVAGSLRVVVPSACWDRPGTVSGLWNAYEHLQRRPLGPGFLSMDDAARYARRRVATTLGQAHGGLILRRDDGWFVATEPLPITDDVFDLAWVFPDAIVVRGLYPVRMSVVARYHSRPARPVAFLRSATQAQVYANMFSTRALAHALSADQASLQHYLLGPDGSVIRLETKSRLKYPLVISADLVHRPGNRHDWLSGVLEQRLRSGALTPVEYVNRVASTYTLQVVVGSALWGVPGRVSGWVPFTAASGWRAGHDPACSPIFVAADDAARHVHALDTARTQVTFGYVLKSMQNGDFVATLPVTDGGSGLTHRRVFSDAGYPYRYQLHGVYIRAPEPDDCYPAGRALQGDGIYRGLVSPTHLIPALQQVHATRQRGALALYLSCADGALLRFVVRDARFVEYADVLKLRGRLLAPSDYIRRFKAAGELQVLVPSEHWPGVAPQALGPVHAHPDDAVGFAHERLGRFSGRQFLGALLENPTTSRAVALLPQADVVPDGPWPAGYRVSAAHLMFHAGLDQSAGAGENRYREYFVSWRELQVYVHQWRRRLPSLNAFYLSARDGALLMYRPRFSDEEYNLLATTGKWSAEGGYTPFAPLPSWFISQLARIGELWVVRAGRFWTEPARLGEKLPEPLPHTPAKDEL
ncbi:MAG: hypothetical protein GAK37_03375 [Pseudomonas sp.]|nr:MAG: hypothetical protein GAK37_03375 [Pseudomonas sp.]